MQRFAAQKKSLLTVKKTQLQAQLLLQSYQYHLDIQPSFYQNMLDTAADCAEPVLVSCLV